jgi:hypothetical protein
MLALIGDRMKIEQNDVHVWKQIDCIARKLIVGEIELVEGAREICALRVIVGESENRVFHAFRALESDLDRFPVGKTREAWDPKKLAILDDEKQKILERMTASIMESCKEISSITVKYI